MSAPGKKDKFTPELRILVASLLSFGVIILWARFFGPKPQVPPPQANRPAVTAPATPVNVAVKSDSQERTIVVENRLYRVEISNHGAVVKSWQLNNYKDDAKPQRVLDVVHPDASQQTGGWPFALVLDDEQLGKAANDGLYKISPDGGTLRAPADAEFAWSDGHLEVTK